MDTTRFDAITSRLAWAQSRRGALRVLGLAVLGGGGLGLLAQHDGEARRKKKKKNRKNQKGGGGGTPVPGKALRELCTPGVDTCAAGLQCDAPTTRNSCSSTVEGVDAWCCVPPGGRCTECDCCGNFYCGTNDQNIPICKPNPEG